MYHKRQGKRSLGRSKAGNLTETQEASDCARRRRLPVSQSNFTSKAEAETRLQRMTEGLNSKETEAADSDCMLGIFSCIREERTKAVG